MDKTTFFLHVGAGKTGTSALQNFLDVNRFNLYTRNNCLYPNFYSRKYQLGRCHNHTKWYWDLVNDDAKFMKDIEKLLQYSRSHSINKVVLSCESWLVNDEVAAKFKKITESFDNVEVKVICYLRRVDSWFESAWKQWGMKEYENYEEYLNAPNVMYRYKMILDSLELLEDFVGIENMVVRPYEKQQLNKGIFYDFLNIIGIDYDLYQWEKNEKTNLSLNNGFNRDVLEMLNLCKELHVSKHDNHIFDLFSDLLGENFQKQPFENYAILSPKQRLDIINKNAPFEKQIAIKYMGREDGRIFYDPLPDLEETWQPYEGLTLEKAIPIIVKMIDQNNQLINTRLKNEDNMYHRIKKWGIFVPIKRLRNLLRKKMSL